MRVLVNDGLHKSGIRLLHDAGFEVVETPVPQASLAEELADYDGVIVRSATKITEEILAKSSRLKVIARGGVGLDNIAVQFATSRGIKVINTPAASSRSVAELVFGHIHSLSRGLHCSNRVMPGQGADEFKRLKKSLSGGSELQGKILGVIGLGRIGEESSRIGMGLGMQVIGYDPLVAEKKIDIHINGQKLSAAITMVSREEILRRSDVITLHVPRQEKAIIGSAEIGRMKEGVIIINSSRGGVIDEMAALEGLNQGRIRGLGLDVFEGEPSPARELLDHPRISVSPHIGASTVEAQEKISIELAERMIGILNGESLQMRPAN